MTWVITLAAGIVFFDEVSGFMLESDAPIELTLWSAFLLGTALDRVAKRLLTMKKIKAPVNILLSILLLLLFSGCSQQKRLVRLLEKNPQPTIVEYIPGEIVVKDSIIHDTIPGEIVIDSIPFTIEVPGEVPDTSITVESDGIMATASVINGSLMVHLDIPDRFLETHLTLSNSTDSIIIRPPPLIKEVKVKPKSFSFWVAAAIVEFLLLIAFIFLLIKLKR